MTRELNEVVIVDAVRTAFGRAGEKGIFWNIRAEDMCVPLLKALIERNPGVKPDDPRVNKWGGAIAYGHPLAASGPRLVAFLCGLFQDNPQARYGLTTMCVGRGQGYSTIWENVG